MSPRLLFVVPETAHASFAIGGNQVGSGRTVPTVAALVGLISVIAGGLVVARSARRAGVGARRATAVSALVLGLMRSRGTAGSGHGAPGVG